MDSVEYFHQCWVADWVLFALGKLKISAHYLLPNLYSYHHLKRKFHCKIDSIFVDHLLRHYFGDCKFVFLHSFRIRQRLNRIHQSLISQEAFRLLVFNNNIPLIYNLYLYYKPSYRYSSSG